MAFTCCSGRLDKIFSSCFSNKSKAPASSGWELGLVSPEVWHPFSSAWCHCCSCLSLGHLQPNDCCMMCRIAQSRWPSQQIMMLAPVIGLHSQLLQNVWVTMAIITGRAAAVDSECKSQQAVSFFGSNSTACMYSLYPVGSDTRVLLTPCDLTADQAILCLMAYQGSLGPAASHLPENGCLRNSGSNKRH